MTRSDREIKRTLRFINRKVLRPLSRKPRAIKGCMTITIPCGKYNLDTFEQTIDSLGFNVSMHLDCLSNCWFVMLFWDYDKLID